MDVFPFIDLSKTKTLFRDVMSLDWKWPVSGKMIMLFTDWEVLMVYRVRGRSFPPYGSSLSQLIAYRCNLFFFSSWVGGILQFCDLISSRNSSDTLLSASPLKTEKKVIICAQQKAKKEYLKHSLTVDYVYKNRNTK